MIAKAYPQLKRPPSPFGAAFTAALTQRGTVPLPGIHEARITKSSLIENNKGLRALLLVWAQAYQPEVETYWRVPQLIMFGQPGSEQRAKAIEMVRQLLWASGYGGADPMILSDKNLLGLRAGVVIGLAKLWGENGRIVPVVKGYRLRL